MTHHQALTATSQTSAAPKGAVKEDTEQYLTFNLGDEVMAIDIRRVREIIQPSVMTIVPLMPDFVRGIINLRGAVVPVIDLQARLGRGCAQSGKKTCIVILEVGPEADRTQLGVQVDAVSEVIDIAPSHIELTPLFGASVAREYLHGLGKVNGRFIALLEPERTFSIDDMAALAEAHAA